MTAKIFDSLEAAENSMWGALGIEILSGMSLEVCAKMPVNNNTSQPFGVLCGGASLAFAEMIAGYGSALLCTEEEIPVGSSVSGNHLSSVKVGPDVWVYAFAHCLHQGRQTHVWNVDIKNNAGRLISTVRVTNFIVRNKTQSWK